MCGPGSVTSVLRVTLQSEKSLSICHRATRTKGSCINSQGDEMGQGERNLRSVAWEYLRLMEELAVQEKLGKEDCRGVWARSAAYSTPRDSASLVSRRTSVLFLRKFGKTWRKGKLHQRGPPASPVLGRECSQGWVIGQHPAQSSWASLRQGCCRAGSCHAWPCFWTTGSSTAAQGSWSPVWSSHRPREL